MAVVIKSFLYAGDGFTVENLVPGDERDFGEAAAGLAAAGYIDLTGSGGVASEPVAVDEPPALEEPVADASEGDKPSKRK